jgi:hypothetical protein
VATRNEAKRALWDASDKDDKARERISKFLAENSRDCPGGFVEDAVLAAALKSKKRVK